MATPKQERPPLQTAADTHPIVPGLAAMEKELREQPKPPKKPDAEEMSL